MFAQILALLACNILLIINLVFISDRCLVFISRPSYSMKSQNKSNLCLDPCLQFFNLVPSNVVPPWISISSFISTITSNRTSFSKFQGHRHGWGWRRRAPGWQAPTRTATATPASPAVSTRTMTSMRTATTPATSGSSTTSEYTASSSFISMVLTASPPDSHLVWKRRWFQGG